MGDLYNLILNYLLYNKIGKYTYFFKQKFPFLCCWQSGVWEACVVASSKCPRVATSCLAAVLQTCCQSAGSHPSPGSASMAVSCLWPKEGCSRGKAGRKGQLNWFEGLEELCYKEKKRALSLEWRVLRRGHVAEAQNPQGQWKMLNCCLINSNSTTARSHLRKLVE